MARPGPSNPLSENYYRVHAYSPRSLPQAADNVFQNAHVDVGLITAAPLAARPGLQLLQQVLGTAQDAHAAEWRWVPVEEGGDAGSSAGEDWAIFSGEVLSVITGNAIPAAFHRVVMTDADVATGDRISMPFFQRPPRDAHIAPPLVASTSGDHRTCWTRLNDPMCRTRGMEMATFFQQVLKQRAYNRNRLDAVGLFAPAD